MRKILSLFFALVFALSISAQVYYLLPNSADANCENITNQYDRPNDGGNRLQWETSEGGVYQCPERNAFDWFARSYCDASIPWIYNEGDHQIRRIVTFKDLTDGRLAAEGNMFNDVKVIWVNVDRNMNEAAFDAMFPVEVRDALANYVKAGGNLYLSTFAARLAFLIGRAPALNEVKWDNGFASADDEWKLTAHFKKGGDGSYDVDKHEHAIFKNLRDNKFYADDYHFHMQKGSPRTNRNCLWDIDDNMTAFNNFQDDNTCGILGSWGHTAEFLCAGLVEFYPKGDWKGTIITNGLAACSFASANTDRFCVEHLTSGILDYLSSNPNLQWNEETILTSGVINEQHIMTASANAGYTVRYYPNTAREIANIGEADGSIYFNYFGTATFRAEAAGDGWTLPKNKYVINSPEITITGGTDANPRYAYVLPYSMHTMANYDNEEGLRPDFEAAAWFYQQFIVGEVGDKHGCFVRPSDLASLNPAIKVLWIHNDHVGKASDDYYNDLGGDTFRDNLRTFITGGGNVFVSKQATRLIGDLGRSTYPAYQNGGYGDRGPWRVGNTWNLEGESIDHSTHAVYANIGTDTEIMASGRHTDNNCIYNNEMLGWTGNQDPQKLHDFETNNNCLILGSWGHNNDVLECVGFVEFYPQNTTEGTIIAMGLAAYHWANPTDAIKTLTRDILYYLNIEETPEFTWVTAPANGSVGTEQIVNVEHKDSEIHWTSSYNYVVEIVDDPGHPGDPEYKKLILKAAGKVTITATRTGDGYKIPKNVKSPTHATKTIIVTAPGVVVVTEPNTEIPRTVNDLVVYQGGSVSNTGDITINNSITYIRPAVGGAASNELGHWYTFCLPFTPSHCYVYEEGDQDYEINSVYLTGSEADTSEPSGAGSFYLQTFAPPAGWAYIDGEGKPLKDTPYIIKFLDGSEHSELADYFTSNPTVRFVGGAQTIDGTDDGTGGTPNGDYSYHVNHTLRKLTMSHVYSLNTATNMFEYDYGGPSEIMPFECYIKASTPALAAARPRFAIGRGAQQGTEITTAVETVAAPLQPLCIYDVTGRLFYTGDEPRQLPQGIWIVRQGKDSRTIVIP